MAIDSSAFAAAQPAELGGAPGSIADPVLSGYYWQGPVTYSFPTLATNYEAGYTETGAGFGAISFAQQQAIRYILEGASSQAGGPVFRYGSFESVALLQISEIANPGEGAVNTADIRVAQSWYASPTAYAYYPAPESAHQGGDIWFGTQHDYRNPVLGTYEWFTLIHELGHAFGLKHGHETDGHGALPANRDSIEFSVMTYRSYVGGPVMAYLAEQFSFPQTLMMYDIAALQELYGANYATNAGDTVYTWSATTGEMFVNGVGQGAPGGNRVFLTIWDGGGNDTYDFSYQPLGVFGPPNVIDLRPGSWTALSDQRAELDVHFDPYDNFAQGNVYNALLHDSDPRSHIENAIGTVNNDTIYGNSRANKLWGGGGVDSLFGGVAKDMLDGGAADDVLSGDAGDDTAYGGDGDDIIAADASDALFGGGGLDSVWYKSATGPLVIDLAAGTVTGLPGGVAPIVSGFEGARGSVGADTMYGTSGTDTLAGDAGNDTIYGGAGADFISADSGVDTLFGGAGNDIYTLRVATTVIVETSAGSGGYDVVRLEETGFTLSDGIEEAVYVKGGGDSIYGNAADNVLRSLSNQHLQFYGGAGDDTFHGSGTFFGGTGDDLYLMAANSFHYVTEAADGGRDVVRFIDKELSGYMLSNHVEVVELTGSAHAKITGNALDNTMSGNFGTNSFLGGAGNDVIMGLDGDDYLAGDAGLDTLIGGFGNDLLVLSDAADIVVETADGGTDTVMAGFDYSIQANIEAAILKGYYGGPTTLTGTGGAGNDAISAADGSGNVEAYYLYGGIGDDILTAIDYANHFATLWGGDGNDTLSGRTMHGGAGDDVYFYDAMSEPSVARESANGGTDTAISGTEFTIPGHIEVGVLVYEAWWGGREVDGNGLGNVIRGVGAVSFLLDGEGGADTLFGDAGDDYLDGGAGLDTMRGGDGDDRYYVDRRGDVVDETSAGSDGYDTASIYVDRELAWTAIAGVERFVIDTQLADARPTFRITDGVGRTVDVFGSIGSVVYGGIGDDELIGRISSTFYGGDGDDELEGHDASTLYGGAGNDVLYDYSSHQGATLFGGAGNDTLHSSSFVETVYGGTGLDVAGFSGGSMVVDIAARTALVDGVVRVLVDIEGAIGTRGSDTFLGDGGANQFDGNYGGSDTFFGGGGNDTFSNGGLVDYSATAGAVDLDLRLGIARSVDGIDTLIRISDVVGSAFDDTLLGLGSETLYGGGGNDTLRGLGGHEILYGGAGDDFLYGGAAYASMVGGAGDDFYEIDHLADLADESAGGGIDRVQVNVAGYTILEGFERIDFRAAAGGVLTAAGATDNTIYGSSANDTLLAGAGNDTIFGDAGSDDLTGGAGFDSLSGGDGNDRLDGGDADDMLSGDIGDDSLFGGVGLDTLRGGAGNDYYAIDRRDDIVDETSAGSGGVDVVEIHAASERLWTAMAGIERIYLSTHLSAMTFRIADGVGRYVRASGSNSALVYGGGGDDELLASSGSTLYGGGGDDTLRALQRGDGLTMFGGDGDDLLDSAGAARTLYGGAGYDIVIGSGVVDLIAGTASFHNTHVLVDIEGASGGSGVDIFRGNGGANLFDGGGGFNTFYGGGGNDAFSNGGLVDYSATAGAIQLDMLAGTATSVDGIDTLSLIDAVVGSAFGDSLSGSGNAETFYGGGGNDTLHGQAGDDFLRGGAGNDTLYGGDGFDTVSFADATDKLIANLASGTASGEGADRFFGVEVLRGGAFNDTLTGDGAANIFFGDNGSDSLTGGVGADTLYGGHGNDLLSGGAGDDTMYGHYGNDDYRIDSTGDVASEADGDGADRATVFVSGVTVSAGIERITLSVAGGATVTAWGATHNTIYGAAGDDVMFGGDGDDLFWGGGGADSFYGGNGNDFFRIDQAGDLAFGGEGYDRADLYGSGATIEWIERIDVKVATGVTATAVGETDNTMTGGAGSDGLFGGWGNDLFYGGAGDDGLFGGDGNDFFYGGAGADTYYGGAGNDFYRLDAGDLVFETDGSGIDKVDLHVSGVTVGEGIERIAVMLATGVTVVAAGVTNNTIHGHNGADRLLAGDGNDSVNGGYGNDTISGGDGSDSLNGDYGNDTMEGGDGNDFLSGDYGNDTVSGDAGNDRLFGYDGNDTMSGGDGNDLVIGGYGNDTVLGGAGNDELAGTVGNDRLVGGTGNDTLHGDGGADVFAYSAGDGNDVLGFYRPEGDKVDLTGVTVVSMVGGLATLSDGAKLTALYDHIWSATDFI